MTEKTKNDLFIAYTRLEETICRLKIDSNNFEKTCKEIIESTKFNKYKFSKRSIVKDENAKINFLKCKYDDGGWNNSIYKAINLPPDDFYKLYNQNIPTEKDIQFYNEKRIEEISESSILDNDKYIDDKRDINRLCNKMFPKWCKIDNNDSISNFMKNINPTKIYTNDEFNDLCIKYKIQQRHLFVRKYTNSKGYGEIFIKLQNNTFKLKCELIETYNNLFINF